MEATTQEGANMNYSETIRQAITAEGERTFGEGCDYVKAITPKFANEEQATRFASLRFTITKMMEHSSGVAWTATLTEGDLVVEVENDGHGGCNTYWNKGGYAERADLERFADEILGGEPYTEEMDALCEALELFFAGIKRNGQAVSA
jgi:hypothetical protein